MNPPDNTTKEKESTADPANSEISHANEVTKALSEDRSRYAIWAKYNLFANRRQTISLDRPSSSNKFTYLRLPKASSSVLSKKYSADELDIKDTTQRKLTDQKTPAILSFHQRFAQTVQPQVQEKQLQVTAAEEHEDKSFEIVDEQQVADVDAESMEQQQLQSTYPVDADPTESFLIPFPPKEKPELPFNAWLLKSRRQTVCEPGPSSIHSSVFTHLPRYTDFKMAYEKSQQSMIFNRNNVNFCEDVNEVQIIDTQDGNVEPEYVMQQEESHKYYTANAIENEYIDSEVLNNSKHLSRNKRKSKKKRSATPGSIDNQSSRKKRYISEYETPQSPNDRYDKATYQDNIRSHSRSRELKRYFSRSPIPKRCRTPARPHTPASPEPVKKGDYIRLLIYDQNMVSGGIFSVQERRIVRAFNTALAAAMAQDKTGFYNGFQLYDAEFKVYFFTFAVNDKKYINPLRQIVDGLPELWENCKLGLMQKGKSLNFVAVVCEIPMNGGTINFHDFLNILQMQNTDIDFNTWGLYKQIDTRTKIYMILRVEASIWKLLKERIIYFLSSTLQFRLRGQIPGFETEEGIQRVIEDYSLLNEFQEENSSDEDYDEYEREFDYNDEEELEEVNEKKRKND